MLKVFNYLINLIVKCYCANENGASPNNGITCEGISYFEGMAGTMTDSSAFCASDQVCTGTTENNIDAVDVSNKGDLCTKGKFQYYY